MRLIKEFNSKKNISKDSFCFVQDHNSHWYCIPWLLRQYFDLWDEAISNEEDSEIYGDYEMYRLEKHPRNYFFESPRQGTRNG